MNDYLDSLKKEALEKDKYVRQIEELSKEFADLRSTFTRWSKHLVSKKANALVDQVEFRDSCGCCPGSIVYAMPYVERNGFRIYSDPCQITIGQNDDLYSDGMSEFKGWKDDMTKESINSLVVELVEKWIANEKKNNDG